MAPARAPSAGREHTGAAVRETITLGIAIVAEVLASGAIEACADIPFVSPLFVILKKAKSVVDKAVRRQEELRELHNICGILTGQVIDKYHATSSGFDISCLQECVEELNDVAEYCGHNLGVMGKLRSSLKHGDRIQNLRERIDRLVPIMCLAAGVNISNQLEAAVQMMNRLMVGPTPKPAPKGLPVCQSWLTMRNGVMDRVLAGLSRGRDPTVMALVGRSGSGKTTAAASFVDLWRGIHRPQQGETEIQARVRSNRVQASFPDGVLWLRVGEGAGSANRLQSLMRTLAKKLCEEVLENSVDDPSTVNGDITSYIKYLVTKGQGRRGALCCLVVADDVWEAAVVDELRETGLWVLVTTRHDSVGFDEKVMVDKLPIKEAENLLRGAAGLQQDERLPDEAMTILERCHYVAMDVAFVGRWSTVRTGRDGVAKGKQAWAEALGEIDAQVPAVRNEIGTTAGMDDREVNRLAVLHAGYMYLGQEDDNAEKLYAALMVLPDGYGFNEHDAAVLLYNHKVHAEHQMKTVEDAVSILEQWDVLRKEASGLYHMHDVHLHFVRANREEWAGIRLKAIRRWTSHISSLKVVCEMDVYTVARLWRALKHVGGEGWQASRPYDAQLVAMSPGDPSKLFAVYLVGDLYSLDKCDGVEGPMRKLVQDCVKTPAADPHVHMAAVYYVGQGLQRKGREKEYQENNRRLSEMVSSGHQPVLPIDVCGTQLATVIFKYGIIALTAGRSDEAEKWLRRALKAQEDKGLGTSSQATCTLDLLGWCFQDAGRPGEAEAFFKRALEIKEAKMEPDDLSIAYTLYALGQCVRDTGRPEEAEAYFKRELEIREAKVGLDDLSVAYTLYELGLCAEKAGGPGGEAFFKRALKIREIKMEPDDLTIAYTLGALGQCVRKAGRPGEAEACFKRELQIREVKMEPNDLSVANTLHTLGQCVQEAGRLGEAEAFFKRELAIRKAKMEPGDLCIANTLYALGCCIQDTGRRGEAESFFKRELEILEAKVDSDDLSISSLLYGLGQCVQDAGRPGEAEALFKRELGILEVKMGPDHLSIANTLHALGQCVLDGGRTGEAEAYFKRELGIREANMEPNDLSIANALYALGRCIQVAGRSWEAEACFKRELQIRETNMGPDDLLVVHTLHALGLCVREAGRLGEAEIYFKRELRIRKAKMEPGDLCVSNTLYALGCCIQDAGRRGEAESFFKRELEILEAKVDSDDLSISSLLHGLGQCVLDGGRTGEAEAYFKRELGIREANMEPNDLSIANVLYALGRCIQVAGRSSEAEACFKRELQIREMNMGPDDLLVAHTLHTLGLCVREAGRLGEAEIYFKRELGIRKAKMEPGDLCVSNTLYAMGCCIQDAGRWGEAESFFKRELEILEAKVDSDDLSISSLLHGLGQCVQDAGRPGEAEALFKRELRILEVKMGPDDLSIANTLHALGQCVLDGGRTGEAESYFKRELGIREANMEPNDLSIANALYALGLCVQVGGRPWEAEALFLRELEIREAKAGPDDPSVSNTL